MHLRILTLAALLLILAACGDVSQPTATNPGATQTPNPNSQQVSNDVERTPTFQSGRGAVVGVLQDMQGRPVVGLAVFLATVNPGEAGTAIVFDPMGSPQSITDAEGRFNFNNIEPSAAIAPQGYSLMTWTPIQTKLVPAPGGAPDSAVLITVEADKVNDAGTLRMEPPE